MTEDLIPIVLFLTVGLSVVSLAYFRYRHRRDQQVTIREVVAGGGANLPPERLEALLEGLQPSPQADLRRGVISLTLGFAVLAFGLVLGEDDAVRPLLGLSAFPFLLGVAYVALWWLRQRQG